MDNLENLRMWVNRQLSQKQKKLMIIRSSL